MPGVASLMKIFSWIFLSILLAGTMNSALAQRQMKAQKLPLEGKSLPDVTAIDENGDPFLLRQELKGKHGVIIFGCLT